MTKSNKWYMTDSEIKRSWRCAINKRDQIGILAELNCKTKAEVEQKIVDLGLELPGNGNSRVQKIGEVEKKKIWLLRLKGNSYKVIAQMIGTGPTWQAVRKAFKIMSDERDEARPVLVKALKAYMKNDACTEDEREIIKTQIARGL